MDITLIANLVLVGMIVIVVIASLIGLWKGIWKTSFKLIFRSVLFLVMVLCAQPIANAVCNINFKTSFGLNLKIGGVAFTTIDQTLAEALAATGKISPVSGMTLYETCFALGHSLASYAIFFVLMLLTLLLGSLLGTIFYHAIFKHLVSKKLRKKRKVRWAGAICGLIDGVLCLVMFVSPLSSMANLVIENQAALDGTHDSKLLDDRSYELIMSGLGGYKDSALYATLGFLGPVSDGIMNKVVEVEVNGVKMGFISELDGLVKILTPLLDYLDFSGANINVDLAQALGANSVHSLLTMLSGSRLVISLIPGLISMGMSMTSGDEKIAEIVNTLDFSDIDWADDLVAIDAFYQKIYDLGLVDQFLDKNFQFDASKLDQYKEAIRTVTSVEVIRKNLAAAMVYSCDLLNKQLGMKIFSTDIGAYRDLDWDREIGCLLEIVTSLMQAFDLKEFTDFNFEESFKVALGDPERLASLKKAIVGAAVGDSAAEPCGLLDLQLLEHMDVKSLALTMLDQIEELKGYIDRKEIGALLASADAAFLKNEFSSILDAAPLIYGNPNLDLGALDLGDTAQLAELKKIIDRVGESQILLTILPGVLKSSLADMSTDMLFGLSIDDLNFYFESGAEFKAEMNRLLDIVPTALSLSESLKGSGQTTEELIKALNLADLQAVLEALYSSAIVNPEHRVDGLGTLEKNHNFNAVIRGILEQDAMRDAGFVVPSNLQSIEWLDRGGQKGEISRLIEAMRVLQQEASFFLSGQIDLDSVSGATISRILEALGNSAILSPSLSSILNSNIAPTLNQMGVTVDFGAVRDWAHEGAQLAAIIDCLQGLSATGDLAAIDWLAVDVDRINAILTAFAATEAMAVRTDENGRYVDRFGSLLAAVFTTDSLSGVLGSSIDASLFQSIDPVTGAKDRGFDWTVASADRQFELVVDGVSSTKTYSVTTDGEIAALCGVLSAVKAAGVGNITSGTADTHLLEETLDAVLATGTLSQVVPDLLASALANLPSVTLDSDNAIDLADINLTVFRKMSQSEKQSEIHQLLSIYDEFKSGALDSVFQDINNLTEEQLTSLEKLLDTMASLQTFSVPKTGERLSLYENLVSSLLNYLNLDQMITNNAGDKARAKQQMISIITSIDQWPTLGAVKGENARLIDLVRVIKGIDLSDLSNAAGLSPEQIENILRAVNPSALLHQAIPTFFEQAFSVFKMDKLLTVGGRNYYPITYRQHLTNSAADQAFWAHEIEQLLELCRALYDESRGAYIDASDLGFGNSASINLYNLLSPIDSLYLLADSKEYVVYSLIANTDAISAGASLTDLIRPIESEGENGAAVRIRKLFFPFGHTAADLEEQCRILDDFLVSMAQNIDKSFSGADSLGGSIAYQFITSTLKGEASAEGYHITRSSFASEIVAGFLEKGFKALDPDIEGFFYGADPATGRDYFRLNSVEALGIKGLLDLAKAGTKAEVAAAIRLLGYKDSSVDSWSSSDPAAAAEIALLQHTHRQWYRGSDASAANSRVALRLFDRYAAAVSIGSYTLEQILNNLGIDISAPTFVFEDLADSIEGLPLF